MNKKLKGILGIVGFVILFGFLVYMKTARKMGRSVITKPNQTEERNRIIEASRKNEMKAFEEAQKKETQRRDSIQQLQIDKLNEQRNKSQEILESLNNEAIGK
ncbi:hypothetical protein [uncultured Flavobacterium sp.]|uniref:hypothetical protein n=1 Tax=uncultured Flavobacterium sp. TaxID=165435 RepID=UPI0030C7E4AD